MKKTTKTRTTRNTIKNPFSEWGSYNLPKLTRHGKKELGRPTHPKPRSRAQLRNSALRLQVTCSSDAVFRGEGHESEDAGLPAVWNARTMK